MSHGVTLLDDLDFAAAGLEAVAPYRFQSTVHLALSLPARNTRRLFTQSVPLFSRRPTIAPTDPNWAPYVALLRELGIPLYAKVPELETLPVAHVPARFAMRCADEPLDAMELETAEAIELTCRRSQAAGVPSPESDLARTLPTLPLELSAAAELAELVEAVRELTESATPIGVGLTCSDIAADVGLAAASGADFVLLEFIPTGDQAQTLDRVARAVVLATQVLQRYDRPVPLLIDAPIDRPQDFMKLLALGASALSLDSFLKKHLPVPSAASGQHLARGLLSGIGTIPVRPVSQLAPAENALRELLLSMKQTTLRVGETHVTSLSKRHLRALSERTAKLTGVPLGD